MVLVILKKYFFFTHKVKLPKISLGLFDLGPHYVISTKYKVQIFKCPETDFKGTDCWQYL